MKYFILGALAVLVVALGAGAYLFKDRIMPSSVLPPTPATDTAAPLPADVAHDYITGSVEGRLCYPSQFLPEGSIEAKNITTNTIFNLSYPGSQNGGQSAYKFQLEPGTYILRYAANTSPDTIAYGYHTQTCPTGGETTCAQANPRVHIQVSVEAGETVSGVDLCDFYYDPQNPPVF